MAGDAVTVVAIVLGASVGAVLRYVIATSPRGTFAVNVAGSLLIGLFAGLALGTQMMHLLGTGLCGALTTYSTFGSDTIRLIEAGRPATAALYVSGTVVCGLAAVWLGLLLA